MLLHADFEQWGIQQRGAQSNSEFNEREDVSGFILQPKIRGRGWTLKYIVKPK